jgi:crossover junction endodeoxyribonuclease RusA
MASVTCELPWPPSANHAWRSVAGKVHRSESYRDYKKTVGDSVLEQRVRRHWTKDRLAIGLVFYPPNPRTFDIDNRVKTVLDCLCHAGVILDDRFVDMIVLVRGSVFAPHGTVLTHIQELSTLDVQFLSIVGALTPTRRDARAYDHGVTINPP